MKLRICPECGSSLDPQETCDCTKKRPPPCQGTNLKKGSTNHSVALEPASVNPDIIELSDLVFPGKVMDKEIVAVIQAVHPKYDKTLHSKCKRGAEYGIQLRRSAIDAVTQEFGVVAHTAPKPRKPDNRSLPRRISCRLSEADYSELQLLIQSEGYSTMQDWLRQHIRQYIKRKNKARTNETEVVM